MTIRNVALAIVMAALIPSSVLAHHSFSAEYDQNKPIKISGKVTDVKWSNPHSWIYIDVETNGKTVTWALETAAANQLTRRGFKKEDLPPGTVLNIEGWQARNGSPTANASNITFTDGRRLFAGSNETPQAK